MEKFETVFRGYNKDQVKSYFDEVIRQYESLLNSKKALESENGDLRKRLSHYESIENTLNHAILNAETAGDQIKSMARSEAESLIKEAKRNANRIINDALLQAERCQIEADTLKRNVSVYKRRLKAIIESQLEIIDEMDKLDLRD